MHYCLGSSPLADTTSAGGDAHVSYGLAFQLVFYSRDGVVTLSDSIEANPAFGDCSEPGESMETALREVCAGTLVFPYRGSSGSVGPVVFHNTWARANAEL